MTKVSGLGDWLDSLLEGIQAKWRRCEAGVVVSSFIMNMSSNY